MTAEHFAIWLQGFFEANEGSSLDSKKTELVKNKLNQVFQHEVEPVKKEPIFAKRPQDVIIRC